MFPQTKLFLVECRTGCSCCSSENHLRGPYSSLEVAEARKKNFQETSLLSSQYAPNGVYHIKEYQGELLPDGRIISGSRVYESFKDNGGDDDIWDRLD